MNCAHQFFADRQTGHYCGDLDVTTAVGLGCGRHVGNDPSRLLVTSLDLSYLQDAWNC